MKSSKKRIKYSEDMMSKGFERSKNAKELKHEFGSCTLYQLFLERKDAESLAKWLNKEIQ